MHRHASSAVTEKAHVKYSSMCYEHERGGLFTLFSVLLGQFFECLDFSIVNNTVSRHLAAQYHLV